MGGDQIPGEIVNINIGGIAHANCIIILNGKVVILIFGDRERRQYFAIFITNDLVVFTYIDSFRCVTAKTMPCTIRHDDNDGIQQKGK